MCYLMSLSRSCSPLDKAVLAIFYYLKSHYISMKWLAALFISVTRIAYKREKRPDGCISGRAKSPTKRVSASSRPPSASTASSSVAPSPAPLPGGGHHCSNSNEVNGGWRGGGGQHQIAPHQQQQPPKRQRPSELRI